LYLCRKAISTRGSASTQAKGERLSRNSERIKVFLLLFLQKKNQRKNLLFLKKKKQKDFFSCAWLRLPSHWGGGGGVFR
jgi:hypothetical protein